MVSLIDLLKKIYDKPGLYLSVKSLPLLTHFICGYGLGELSCKDRYPNITISDDTRFWRDFNRFVHLYYKCEMGAMREGTLIAKYCDSDEEAFDKYFELLDMFLKQRGESFFEE